MTMPRLLILAEINERLSGLAAEVEIMPSSDPVEFPALHIFDNGHATEDGDTGASRYDLNLTIEGFVEGMGGSAAHTALVTLQAQVVAALMLAPPLAGLAETISEGDTRIGSAPLASETRIYFSTDFTITFPTKRGDPALVA